MAKIVMMKHEKTGVVKKGFYGFSWTSFFFSGFPALLRGDVLTGWSIIGFTIGFYFIYNIVGFLVLFHSLHDVIPNWFRMSRSSAPIIFPLNIAWASIYNKRYTLHLLKEGYQFCDTPAIVAEAKMELGIPVDPPTNDTPNEQKPS